MSAQFPLGIKQWLPTDETYPVDLKEIVYARHVTTIYEEVTAMQRELGAGGLKSSTNYSGTYNVTPSRVWDSLKARLENIEQGAFDGVTKRVNTAGGSSIVTPSGTVGLSIRAAGGSSDILQLRNTANAIATKFGSDGLIAGIIDGGNA